MGIILFNNPTATFISQKLIWVSHDGLTRLLSIVSINNSNIIILFIQCIQSQTAKLGYLIIDDVIIRKPYGKSIFPTTSVYDHTNNRYVWGMHIVVLIKNNRKAFFNDKVKLNVNVISKLFNKKQFRYYPKTGFYIKAITVNIPNIGKVRLAMVKNGYNADSSNIKYIITDMLDCPAQDIVEKYLSRWEIEVFFRDIKQHLNFEKVQVRSLKKLEGYFSLVFVSFIFIQVLQIQNNLTTIGETIRFLQEIVQVKVNNVLYVINI